MRNVFGHTCRLLMTMLLSLSGAVAWAQGAMIVEHYTKNEGLPSNAVYCAFKDSDNFLWLGTWYGLCTFDGAVFRPYLSKTNTRSDLPPRKVRNVVADGNGYLWVRNTDNHLYVFDKTTEVYHDVYNELKKLSPNVQVIKVQRMTNGHVLVLTRNKNIYEAYIAPDKQVVVKLIHDSRRDIDNATMALRHHVLGETGNYVYWLSRQLDVKVMQKTTPHTVLRHLLKHHQPTCFNAVEDKYACVGTDKGGVYVVNLKDGKTKVCSSPTFGHTVYGVEIIKGKVYAATAAGLYLCSPGATPKQVAAEPLRLHSTYTDRQGLLWLFTKSNALVCYQPATNKVKRFVLPTDSLFAEMKFQDAGDNGLFMLLRNGEVWRYDYRLQTMQNLNVQPDFANDVVSPKFFDIDTDSEGALWLSSITNGVYKVFFPKNNFRFFMPELLGANIRSVFQTHGGDLWVGSREGELYGIDTRTNTVKCRFSKQEVGVVYHVMEDSKGNLWFSTKGSGLVKATPDVLAPQGLRLTRYTNRRGDKTSLSSNRVYYTYEDSKGRIWVCTFNGGLNLLQQKRGGVVFHHKLNGFAHYPRYGMYTDVRCIAEDRHGRMWVGTTDGLMSFDGRFGSMADISFETYRNRAHSGVTDNDIYTLYKDLEGNIWMGIFGNGLNLLERYDEQAHCPVLKSYIISDQQQGDVITSIVEDNDHCLWICTETMLASMSQGASFVHVYDRYLGFPQVTIEDNAMTCLADGTVLLGTKQGLLAFSPQTVRQAREARHTTFIVGMKVANKELWAYNPPIYEGALKYADRVELQHDQATFTIEFAAPCYADNNFIQYTYILDGYEKQWHENGNNRMASYANVPPGHYQFRVKVNDGISPERVIDIVILPPWWATWWAYLIYIVLALLALYGALRLFFYTVRMRNEVYINNRLAELKIRFFTNVSHELRTPLSLIKGPIEELKSTEQLTDTGKEYLTLIDRNAHKMLQLVNQILDFRKIQSGKMKLHVSLVDINSIIEMLMQEYRMLAEERDIAFVFEKPADRVMVWCDAEKIGVVLNNLINNAFKYTEEGGKICVALQHDYAHRMCTISVEDDGADIPKSQLEQIFERFTQANNTKAVDDSVFAGTGIGLSLAREYVNMHHGRIWAENMAPGKGVVFSVQLHTDKEHYGDKDIEVYFDDSTAAVDAGQDSPDSQEHDITPPCEGDDAAETLADRPSVLVVEDNIDLCHMLQLQLRNTYNVYVAHQGEEGLKKIYQYHPDVIVTDLMMPGLSGLELLRHVRHDFTISHIPVVVLTAKNTDEDKVEATRLGANAFIAKPFSSSYLQARIQQLLEEQRIFQRKMVVQSKVEDRASDTDKDEYEQHLVKKDIEFVEKIHEVIEANLNANDFNIDTIAETIGLSRSAFFKKLKSLTGFAPVDLVREIRLTKAAKLIETTDANITEVAYTVGFRDAGYFGKCFRKKYGMSPKEYKNSNRPTISTEKDSGKVK